MGTISYQNFKKKDIEKMKIFLLFFIQINCSQKIDKDFCAKACQCDCGSSSWDYLTTIFSYLNCETPTMASIFGLIDANQAQFATKVCKSIAAHTDDIQEIYRRDGWAGFPSKSEEVCKIVAQGIQPIEKKGMNLDMVKAFNPQCDCIVRSLSLVALGKPNIPSLVACLKGTTETTKKLISK